MKNLPGGRALGITIGALVALFVIDLAVWAVHVQWRDASMEELNVVTEQIESLVAQLTEDDDWIERNSRLTQQYSQHAQFTSRLEARGRRRTAHNALVDAYNGQVVRLYQRFYVALAPAPDPPLRERWDP